MKFLILALVFHMQNLWISSIFIPFAPSKESLFQHVNVPSLVLADEIPSAAEFSATLKSAEGVAIQTGPYSEIIWVALDAASSLLDAPSMRITQVPCRNTTQGLPCLPEVFWIILRHVSVICSLTTTMSAVGHWLSLSRTAKIRGWLLSGPPRKRNKLLLDQQHCVRAT